MSYHDRTSLDSWIDFKEYESSRGDIGGGGGSFFSGGSSGGSNREDHESLIVSLVLDGETDKCQTAIEQYDWAKSADDDNCRGEPIVSNDDWRWMTACYEKALLYRREYGMMLFDTDDVFSMALVKTKAKAERGNAVSQMYIGELLWCCVAPSFGWQKAIKWISKAANQGLKEAQYFYGNCYCEGMGVKRSETTALMWWRKAAKQGCSEAQVRLAYHAFMKGNKTKVLKSFVQAAENGSAMAQAWAGVCYEYGLGAKPDHEKAVLWLRRSAEGGLLEAQLWMKQYGDVSNAERWMCKAKMQAVSDNLQHRRRASRRTVSRTAITDAVIRYMREHASEEDFERLGKRGKPSAWGCLIALALLIGGCYTMF